MRCEKEARDGRFVLTLGGDHGLASGSITGVRRVHENLKIVWIDAHGDCNIPETTPSLNYHGMPMAHCFGWIPKDHIRGFDWLDVFVKPENIVYIGLRDLDKGEIKLLKDHKIKVYTPYDIEFMGGIGNVMREVAEYLSFQEKPPIHISWDIDGCDPEFTYGTGTKARGGLTYRESHFILQYLHKYANLVSMDMVEINPELEKKELMSREVFHGDNKLLQGPSTLCYAMEFVLSALGFTWI
jgi:arginase